MNDFENELKKQPLRRVPEHWRAQILRSTAADTLKCEHQRWWSALFWPSPKAWGTLAAAWVAMICFHIAFTERSKPSEPSEAVQIRMAIEQKRQLEAEIEEAAVRLEQESPKPRSEIMHWGKSA
jgi:hypothetical protein